MCRGLEVDLSASIQCDWKKRGLPALEDGKEAKVCPGCVSGSHNMTRSPFQRCGSGTARGEWDAQGTAGGSEETAA